MSADTITVSGLSKWFGQKVAVSELSCSFSPGVTGILGPNGAGKTTLLRCLVGLLEPSDGTIDLPGAFVTCCGLAQFVALLLQLVDAFTQTIFDLITLTDVQTGTLTPELEHLPRPDTQHYEEKQPHPGASAATRLNDTRRYDLRRFQLTHGNYGSRATCSRPQSSSRLNIRFIFWMA